MNGADRMIRVGAYDVDVSGLVWVHPTPGAPNLSLLPVVTPGGYPPALSTSTIALIRAGLEADLDDGSLGWATAISYISGLARFAEWLRATGRVAPGGAWDLAGLDVTTARAFLVCVKEMRSKNTVEVSRNALAWAYQVGIRRGVEGFRDHVPPAVSGISYRGVGTPAEEGVIAPTFALPCEPDLPAIPASINCKGKVVRIEGLRMICPGEKAIGLERVVRPVGRPSVLSPRAQQLALIYTVEEIQGGSWARNQVLNAIDRFAQWLAWRPEWREAGECFEWARLTPKLAGAYFEAVRAESKGRDWWIFLRGLYRWGVQKGFVGFDAAVERELMNVGLGRGRTVHGSAPEDALASRFRPDPSLPAIQPIFGTPDRKYTVRTTSPIWRRHDADGRPAGAPLNLALLEDPPAGPQAAIYSMVFLHLVRLYIARQASRRWAWRSVRPFVTMLRDFQTWLYDRRNHAPESFGVEHLSDRVLAACKMHMEGDEGPGHSGALSMLRVFYEWGCKQRLPNFDPQVLERLRDLKFTNNPRGEIAKAVDPVHGAFSMTEQRVLKDVLEDPDWGSVEEKALVRLCWYLGPRPVQIAALKAKHLEKLVTPHGVTFVLRIPRAKKGVPTEETVARGIPSDYSLGQLLEELCPPGTDPEREMFPSLAGKLAKEAAVARMLKNWAYRGGPKPLRTRRVLEDGKPALLPIHAYRFRRTMATNLARQRASAEYVAQMLDDDDIRMAVVYTENTSELVRELGDTVDAGEYLDILGGFFGEFENGSHRSLPVVQPVAVDGPGGETLLDLGGTGRCGAGSLCDLAWPLSCYACKKFKPREGGPHEQMLMNVDAMIAQHARQGLDRHAEIYKRIRERIAIVIEEERRQNKNKDGHDPQEAMA